MHKQVNLVPDTAAGSHIVSVADEDSALSECASLVKAVETLTLPTQQLQCNAPRVWASSFQSADQQIVPSESENT